MGVVWHAGVFLGRKLWHISSPWRAFRRKMMLKASPVVTLHQPVGLRPLLPVKLIVCWPSTGNRKIEHCCWRGVGNMRNLIHAQMCVKAQEEEDWPARCRDVAEHVRFPKREEICKAWTTILNCRCQIRIRLWISTLNVWVGFSHCTGRYTFVEQLQFQNLHKVWDPLV